MQFLHKIQLLDFKSSHKTNYILLQLHSCDFFRFVQLKAWGETTPSHIPVWFYNNLKSLI